MVAFIVAAMDHDSGGADARISPKVIFLLAFHGSILPRSLAELNRPYSGRNYCDGCEKETGAGVRRSAGSLAPIEDWIEHRREMDRLEAELRVSHPDLAWSDELQSLKAEADAAIKALTP
jgi:hypothetical protein